MLQMVICDDDKSITAHIRDLVDKKYKKKIKATCLYSAQELMQEIQNNQVDMIILDIALGEDDGIVLAKEIGTAYPDIKIILLSGYAQLASNVFDADPVYFLSKPIRQDKLYAAIDKAIEIVKNQTVSMVTVKAAGGKVHRIAINEIVYMETGHRSCKVFLDDGRCIEVPIKLSEMMAQLPECFIFTHQSFACNINKVKSFSKEDGIDMANGQNVPVSRRHYKKVKELISMNI